jgi:hypothetical protein
MDYKSKYYKYKNKNIFYLHGGVLSEKMQRKLDKEIFEIIPKINQINNTYQTHDGKNLKYQIRILLPHQ